MTIQGAAFTRPTRAAGYVRISNDPSGLEKGVTRQMDDIRELAARLGWTIIRFYVENDTSAYKKRKIKLPDGKTVWRVIRPEFRQMLDDLESGEIDGIIVYDLDRLARQPRDLEDLIDLIQAYRRPVQSVTGSMDMTNPDGQAMARMLTVFANKSSQDTARRVSRARLQEAQEGKTRKRRRFGRTEGGEIIAEEANAAQWAAQRLIDGESWASTVTLLERGEVRPVSGGRWHVATVRNILLSPSIAGIAMYNGGMRDQNDGRTAQERLMTSALKNADGTYVMTDLDPILTVEQWETLCATFTTGREGGEFSGVNTKRYLLSGLLRCGKPREDGTICNHPMSGTRINQGGHQVVIYRCPGPKNGGCAGVSRRAAPIDKLIEDTFFAYLAAKTPTEPTEPEPDAPISEEQEKLSDATRRLARLREQYATGGVTEETFFATVPLLEAAIKKLTKAAKEAAGARRGMRVQSAETVREKWDKADTAGRRAILGQYLNAVVVLPAARGRGKFEHNTIKPMWKEVPTG
jgi:DNA invertase Pin-like site-specific DNA recombinase